MIFAVRGDDIFEAEHLPSYARTYILPRQMVRMLEYSLNDDNTFTDFSFVKLPKRRKMPMVIQLSVSPSQVYNFFILPKSFKKFNNVNKNHQIHLLRHVRRAT